MPVPGVSLVGFMQEPMALAFLQQACIADDPNPDALRQQWIQAREKLGNQPTPKAGAPDILDLPAEAAEHLAAVAAHPRLAAGLDGMTVAFGWVEIKPLLAYQFHIDVSRMEKLCSDLGRPPTVTSLLNVCLPIDLEPIAFREELRPNSYVAVSDSANFRIIANGQIGLDLRNQVKAVGIAIGPGIPWVQVVRFEGRCYLRNGYHRLFGALKAGATHVPAIVLDAPRWELVGVAGGGASFDRDLLESANPPTLAHYTVDRAWPVTLRRFTRIIHASWSEYVLPEAG